MRFCKNFNVICYDTLFKTRQGYTMRSIFILLFAFLTLFAADKSYEYGDLEERHDGLLIEVKTHNLANGVGKFYYASGKLRGETPFKDGKREGMGKTYYESGELQGEAPFKNDVIEGVKKSYFTSGRLQSETPFQNDQAEGIATLYYESGKIQSQTPFHANKAEGVAKLFDENGKLSYEVTFEHSIAIKGFAYDAKGSKTPMSENELKTVGL